MVFTKTGNSGNAKPFKGSGVKGQSLFHTFIIQVAEKELKLINENYIRHLSYIRKAEDDRLLAIVGALAVEEALDSLLRAYIPEYKILDDKDRLSFYVKIKLARSLKLIPTHLLKAVDTIREIRNEFSHKLHKDDFNSLAKGKKDRLIKIFKELHPDDDVNSYSTPHIFSTTISGLLVSLGVYSSNLRLAKEYIYGDDFFLKIKEIAESTPKMKNQQRM